MKHKAGNTPACYECFFFRETEEGERNQKDGWCYNKTQCATGANGRKRSRPPEREPVNYNNSCRSWEDAEDRITHYEATTRKAEERRPPEERERIQKLLDATHKRTEGEK